MQQQLTFQEGTSHKFWHIETVAEQLHVHYGRVGTAGQRQTKSFASAADCETEAAKLVNEKLRKGYSGPGSARAPTPASTRKPVPSLPTAGLRLRPELIAGKRIRMVGGFKKYRLGSKSQVKALLEYYGAIVVSATARNVPYDFVLGSYHWQDMDAGIERKSIIGSTGFDHPVVFEEELCEPEPALFTGPLAGFRARLLAQVRTLLQHPLIQVTCFVAGLPLTDAQLDSQARKLGRPLPALLRAFYRQVGELQLLWAFPPPRTQQGLWIRPGRNFNLDGYDNHDGAIRIFPLAQVLSKEWHDPGYCFALSPQQQGFDYYSEYHFTAIELADAADPLLYIGDDYGVSFDSGPVPLSEYLELLLRSYGRKKGIRLPRPGADSLDLDSPAHFTTQETITDALFILAWRIDGAPVPLDAGQAAALADCEARYFAILEHAIQHQPAFSFRTHHAYARGDARINGMLDRPRYLALHPDKVRSELAIPHETLLRLTDLATSGTFTLRNDTDQPLTVLGHRVELVVWPRSARELVLAYTDSADSPGPVPPPIFPQGRNYSKGPLPPPQLPGTVAPKQVVVAAYALDAPDGAAQLAARGVASSQDWYAQPEQLIVLRLTVRLAGSPPLTDESEVSLRT